MGSARALPGNDPDDPLTNDMPKYEVTRHITRNGVAHEIGSTIELTEKEAQSLPVRLKVEPKTEAKKGKE